MFLLFNKKNWKSRLSAYEDLKKDILINKDVRDSPVFTEFGIIS